MLHLLCSNIMQKSLCKLHMFQLSRFERRAPFLPVLPEISRCEMILAWMSDIDEVDHTFYKLDVKILAAINDIRRARCSYPPSSLSTLDPCQTHLLF